MAYVIMNTIAGASQITDVDSSQRHPLGFVAQATDPTYGAGQFIYLKGVASTAVGSWVVYRPDDATTALASTSTTGFVAVAMSANTAATTYGWYQIMGKGVAKAATVVDDAKVWATATPGTADDATADGYMIHNAWWGSADGTPSAGLAEVELLFPYIDGITTND